MKLLFVINMHKENIILNSYFEVSKPEMEENHILNCNLIHKESRIKATLKNGVPRFISGDNYTDNFGLQWNYYKQTQMDSHTGLPLTQNRFYQNTKWTDEEMKNKKVLEVGSGAGRFTEILLNTGCELVSFDFSNAVEANYSINGKSSKLFLFQGDLFDIPFPDNYFDFVFCFGVLQHTPNPVLAYEAIFKKLKPGGKISIDYYLKVNKPSPWSFPKYFWRPLTTKMSSRALLWIIKRYIPIYLPFDTFIRRNFKSRSNEILGRIPIPCWNYLDIGLSKKQRLEWAILDTFDALGPTFDYPKTLDEVAGMVNSPENEELEIFYGSNGVVANIKKTRTNKY